MLSTEPIPVLSLFSGAGGLDVGFSQAGFKTILAIDSDPAAVRTFNFNAKRKIAVELDLSLCKTKTIIDLLARIAPGQIPKGVIGGPPCQYFSAGNVHRRPDDDRRNLIYNYSEIVSELNRSFGLEFFVFENVSGLAARHAWHFQRLVQKLRRAGFSVFDQMLNAANFGVPQTRKRVFLIGLNERKIPVHSLPEIQPTTPIPSTVRDAIFHLPEPKLFARDLTSKQIPFHPNHWAMNPRSKKFNNNNKKTGRSFRRLEWDRPSTTVAYGHREMHIHPNGARRVSVYEAMLLQGFPDRYRLLGNFSAQVTQVSNAVPPPLGRSLGLLVREQVFTERRNLQGNLLSWYRINGRTFPWRTCTNPFHVLVAEKLLQQTAATNCVVKAFNTMRQEYPNARAMSTATEAEIASIIKPLGFTFRSREFICMAKQIQLRHQGSVPKSLEQLKLLPGIGDYIARAVLSFSFNRDVAVVDTNVARFLYRVFDMAKPMPSNPARHRGLIDIADALIPAGKSKAFNLSILDLCATVCTPKNPKCHACPVSRFCRSRTKVE